MEHVCFTLMMVLLFYVFIGTQEKSQNQLCMPRKAERKLLFSITIRNITLYGMKCNNSYFNIQITKKPKHLPEIIILIVIYYLLFGILYDIVKRWSVGLG